MIPVVLPFVEICLVLFFWDGILALGLILFVSPPEISFFLRCFSFWIVFQTRKIIHIFLEGIEFHPQMLFFSISQFSMAVHGCIFKFSKSEECSLHSL
jgi:hypothetical protein